MSQPSPRRASGPVFEIENLSVSVQTPDGPLTLIHDVSLNVHRGEAVGVVGESGCGKSVSFMAALGLMPRGAKMSGSVRLFGEELLGQPEHKLQAARGTKVGMIFQDPQSALNPVRTIGTQLIEPLQLHMKMSRAQARVRAEELLTLVGIPAPATRMNAYPHQISGGMCQRVMIAMALASEPQVLIADEPTTALDATVQLQVLDLLAEIQSRTGLALILITHDLGVVARTCDRLTIMYAGRTVESQSIEGAFTASRHPYTRALIDCLPSLDFDAGLPRPIAGEVPTPGHAPSGCAFHPRCALATDVCLAQTPAEITRGSMSVSCHFPMGGKVAELA